MKFCLVTGGAGFIGSHLVDTLLAQGHAVRVLDDLSTGNPTNLASSRDRIEFIQGSVTDTKILDSATSSCDVIYHLAALPSVALSVEDPWRVHEACDAGTLRLLDAARKQGVRRVVYAASSSAYGDQPGEIRNEDDALLPPSPYAASKLAGEHYCQAFTSSYGLETVRLRFFNVFGPRQDAKNPYSGVIALFLSAMGEGKRPTIFGDGLQARDFVYVENVVQALTKAAKAPANVSGRVYNVGSGRQTNLLELVQTINALLGSQLQPIFAPPRAGDVRFSLANIQRAKQDFGYAPNIPFRDGLARTMESFKK